MKKKVLIVDDDPKMAGELMVHFDAYNNDWEFEIEIASKPEELYEKLKVSKLYDIVVIDRRFDNLGEAEDVYLAVSILHALKDLRIDCLRIIWTAYSELEHMKQCFRLGAYDYIEKGEGCFSQVLSSALKGLQEKKKLQEKEATDLLGHEYVCEHYPAIFDRYKGQYLALKQINKQDNTWETVASDSLLTRLYNELNTKASDQDILHITFIQE